jgi:hypothetical protein
MHYSKRNATRRRQHRAVVSGQRRAAAGARVELVNARHMRASHASLSSLSLPFSIFLFCLALMYVQRALRRDSSPSFPPSPLSSSPTSFPPLPPFFPPSFSSLLLLPPPPPSSSSFAPPTYSLSWQMRSPFLDFSRRSLRSLHLWPSEQRASHRTTPLSSPPPPSFLSRSSPSCPLTRHRSARCCARPAMPLFVARCTRQVRSAQRAARRGAQPLSFPLPPPPSFPLIRHCSARCARPAMPLVVALCTRQVSSAPRGAQPLSFPPPSSSSFHLIRRRRARCARPALSKCAQRATPLPLVVARCARSPAALRKMHNECRM